MTSKRLPTPRRAWLPAALVFAAVLLAACSQLRLPGDPANASPQSEATQAETSAAPVTGTAGAPTSPPPGATLPAPDATIPTPGAPGPQRLTVWVPPQFDFRSPLPAGVLFSARLEAFKQAHPDIQLEVRTKALEGPGGLLDSLTAASAAAPLALPDLIALPYPMLETAALKGLLYTHAGLSAALQDDDWYGYARELAMVQSSVFGLPFAGDALALVYRPEVVAEPPADWAALLEGSPLIFPAADPQALFTLVQYLASGGQLRDEQGRPLIDAQALGSVFTFYQQGAQAGRLPFWLTQLTNDSQAWQAFNEKRSDQVVIWLSQYMSAPPEDARLALLPTPDGKAASFANGWVWALSTAEPTRQTLAIELAKFLTESSYLAEWSAAAGLLPPRPSAVGAWPAPDSQALLAEISLAAHPFPTADLLSSLGAPIQSAAVRVLKEEVAPQEAADQAAGSLPQP